MSDAREIKRRPGLAALSLIIGLVAFAAFIFLNRMMAPPFPKFAVSPLEGLTNAIRQAASNSSPSAVDLNRTKAPDLAK